MRPQRGAWGQRLVATGTPPLYPDLLLETCQSLFNQQASQSMGMEGEAQGGCWWPMITPSTGHC